MPQQWWFVLRERTSGQGRFSPSDCNGLINELWPQADAAAHKEAKPWVLHGLPQAIGGTHIWSVTWLSDLQNPPQDLRDQIGGQWTLGARRTPSARTFDVESVIAGLRRTWAHLLETRPVQVLQINTVTHVVGPKGRPTLTRLLGAPPREGITPSSSSHRQNGIFSIIQAYAAPQIAALVTDQLAQSVPHLNLSFAKYVTQSVPGPKPHSSAAAGKRDRPAPSPQGWAGQCTLLAQQTQAQQGLSIIGSILQTAGVGKSTAYGYGCVTVEVPRTPGQKRNAGDPAGAQEATAQEAEDDEQSLDILFETP